MILEYLTKFHIEDCLNIISEKDNLGYYSINIDFLKLFETYPDVGDKVLCNPVESLPICNQNIIKVQQNILELEEHQSLLNKLDYKYLKRNVNARFYGLPVCPELHRTVFPKNVDLGCFLKITGTIVRVTQSKMLEYQRKYVCMKCRFENEIKADFEHRYILRAPSKCGNTESRCKSTNFNQVQMISREYCKDYQEIKIQEQVNKLSIGTIPGSLWVVLEDDLVDCCKPGDDVNICGIVRRRWRPTALNKKAEVDLVLQANYIEVCNSQRSDVVTAAPDVKECFNEFWSQYQACPLKGRDQILCSVCPQVYGLHLVKLAVLLTVITGSNHIVESDAEKKHCDDEYTTRVRGQCHLLLVGDPGTGKSQLLQAGAQLTARSVLASGAGSTRAGLTCAALREDGEWQLEAGALVLSDGGVCCIDEISQLREHDRTAIHEAMEQQTISIAKAGIVCKLNTRCAVLAACNPKGRYETDQPLSVNVSLGTPLLSRFDLIFILLDSKNKTWDKLVSSYILFGGSNATDSKKRWSLEKLQMYISLVGPRRVEMTKSANVILQSYYMMQRKSEHRDPSRTTVRMLDSLVRLSHAHCRLMYRTTILPMDAVVAVSLVDLSMQDCTLDDTADALHSTFQKYPDMEYLCTAKNLLTKLKLYEIWSNELLYYAKLLQVDYKTLESSIDSSNYQLFAKYDDVADENIPLSSSIVTSSYFKVNKRKDNDIFEDQDNENNKNQFQEKNVNEKLAVTLKKHAALNKSEKKPPSVQKQKRKRKEVTVLVNKSNNKKAKKPKNVCNKNTDISASDEEFDETNTILNAVPSVNDVFKNLGIDFNFDNDNEDTVNQDPLEESNQNTSEIKNNKKHKEKMNSNVSINRYEETKLQSPDKKEIKTTSSTLSKLKQFVFVEKRDLSKSDEKSVVSPNKTVVKLEKNEESISIDSLKQKPSVSSSQISMFESSDCDLDLDL